MPLSFLFWGIYILSIVFGFFGFYEPTVPFWYRRAGSYLVLWILVGMLGWRIFGPAIR